MSVSEEVVLKSGENTSAVRVPPELGGGYLAWAEVNHQLHCVNLLRKALHPYWDYYVNITADFQREPEQVQVHLGKPQTNTLTLHEAKESRPLRRDAEAGAHV